MHDAWPALPYADWKDTKDTLHMWSQVVGKTALSHAPRANHWWNAGLHVTARGVGTGTLYEGGRAFEARFDFIGHKLRIMCSDGRKADLALEPMSVAAFHDKYLAALHALGIKAHIWPMAVEIPEPVSLRDDTARATYNPEQAERLWRVLLQVNRMLETFRAQFLGKASPVLFWWGTFDICVTLFSGRPAPPREGADRILREGMSHEEMSFGWWPGDEATPEPYFYAYASPEPEGIGAEPLRPAEAFYSADKHEFFLPYDAVRTASDPDAVLREFCRSVYGAGAKLANWDPALLRAAI